MTSLTQHDTRMDVDGKFSTLHSCLPIFCLPYLEQSKEAACKQAFICTANQLLKKPGKLRIQVREGEGQSTLRKQFKQQHGEGEITDKKTIFQEEGKLFEAGYWGATGERQPGEVWRAGDFLGSVLMAGDSNGKVATFFPKLDSSPGVMLHFILVTQGLLWPRDYFRNKKDQTKCPVTAVACLHHQLEVGAQEIG